jgi:hypothetical protein
MSSCASAEVKQFEVERFGRMKTTLADVDRFIEQHRGQKDVLIEIDPAGIGDCFADYLEDAGFTVWRISSQKPNRALLSSISSV